MRSLLGYNFILTHNYVFKTNTALRSRLKKTVSIIFGSIRVEKDLDLDLKCFPNMIERVFFKRNLSAVVRETNFFIRRTLTSFNITSAHLSPFLIKTHNFS